jgi:two-component system sensor histidine kinase/response regulator
MTEAAVRIDAPNAPAVLFLDDEPKVLSGLKRALRKEPYEVLCATSAEEALALLQERPIDVVISDQDMPGMTGAAFLAQVRQAYPSTSRFMLTGKATLDVALQAINEDAVKQFFTKPCDPATLAQSIRNSLHEKALEQALQRAQQQELELKDRLLSHVSHELRSPLAAIYQFITIVLDGLAGDVAPAQRQHLEVALRNVNQLRAMVSDLLDCSRAANGKLTVAPQPTDIIDIVHEVLEARRPEALQKGLDLQAALPPAGLPRVAADPVRLRQVLVNLVDNAIKFTPAPGAITVRHRTLAAEPEMLCITVADTGCGLRPEDATRIFERLSQTTEGLDVGRQGLGLGLYICSELMQRHGGRIWVESELGRGSTFCFTLPLCSNPTGAA